MDLRGKKILLAVTGSIAAYKTPHLVRLLIKSGAEVRVILTPAASDFVSPLSLSTVSGYPVLYNVHDGASWNNHVELGRWADLMLVAPCSANTLARLAQGICDNLVGAVYLSATCPVFFAPAMDEDMWLHPATISNVKRLLSFGNRMIPVGHGELASGLIGVGRLAEPEEILKIISEFLNRNSERPLAGKKVLVTAGPTYERLDPVRFIGNFSTGKMGIALAESMAQAGASVSLVLGPTSHETTAYNIETIPVESAEEMYQHCVRLFPECSIAIMAAAVADYKPAMKAGDKIKKTDSELSLPLVKTQDILAALGRNKQAGQYLVGFALETQNEKEHALQKLKEKNADLIVLNSLQDPGAGFGYDTNKVTLLSAQGEVCEMPLQSKTEVANNIVNYIIEHRYVEERI